jgi:hypothetical protein
MPPVTPGPGQRSCVRKGQTGGRAQARYGAMRAAGRGRECGGSGGWGAEAGGARASAAAAAPSQLRSRDAIVKTPPLSIYDVPSSHYGALAALPPHLPCFIDDGPGRPQDPREASDAVHFERI